MALLRLLYRYRTLIRVSFIAFLFALILILLYDPVVLLSSVPMIELRADGFPDGGSEPVLPHGVVRTELPSTTSAGRTPEVPVRPMRPLILPFVPRDYVCEDIMEQAGRQFTYPETYWDHADAYKSALILNNILSHATTSEFSWIIQELARMPGMDTVCETSFDAGANTFQWLVADDTTIVHSFDRMERNYSLEMTDFMAIEFPEAFFIHAGDPRQTIPDFVRRHRSNVTCDIIFIDTSEPADVIKDNIINLRPLANPEHHLIVLDMHPSAPERKAAAMVWKDLAKSGLVNEYFKCRFDNNMTIGKTEYGITIGIYN